MNPTNLKAVSLVFLVAGAVLTGLVIAAAQGPAQPDQSADQPPGAGAKTEQPARSIAQKKIAERQAAKAKRQAAASSKAMKKAEAAGDGQPQAGGMGGMMGMGMGMGGGRGGMGGSVAGPMGGKGLDEESFGGGGLVVEDYRAVRRDNAELAAAMMVWDKTPQNEDLLKALDRPLTMSFAKPTPLDAVLKYIKSSRGGAPLPIYVDPKGLEDAEVKMDSKVIIDLEGVPLKTSLRLILKQVGLAYCVRDGVLIISSDEGIHQELAEQARELMGSEKAEQLDFRTLMRTGVIKPRMGGMGGGMGGTGGMGGMSGGGMGMM